VKKTKQAKQNLTNHFLASSILGDFNIKILKESGKNRGKIDEL